MQQPTILLDTHKIRYSTPLKVTATQYKACMFGDLKGTCFGTMQNGEYYLRLTTNRHKFLVELTLNTTE